MWLFFLFFFFYRKNVIVRRRDSSEYRHISGVLLQHNFFIYLFLPRQPLRVHGSKRLSNSSGKTRSGKRLAPLQWSENEIVPPWHKWTVWLLCVGADETVAFPAAVWKCCTSSRVGPSWKSWSFLVEDLLTSCGSCVKVHASAHNAEFS